MKYYSVEGDGMPELQPERDPRKELVLVICPHFGPSFQVLVDLHHIDEGIGLTEGGELIDHLIESALNEAKNALLVVGRMMLFEGSVLADLANELSERR